MVHSVTRRARSATMAVMAAGAVMFATTTTVPPSPPAVVAAAPISTQAVHLMAGAEALPAALPDVAEALQGIPEAIIRGVIAPVWNGVAIGVFAGFVAGGALAIEVLSHLPENAQEALSPLATVTAVAGAVIGASIGAVWGPLFAAVSLVSSLVKPASAAATRVPAAARKTAATAYRSTQAGSRSSRTITNPAPGSRKAAAPQQHSDPAKPGSGRHRAATSNRAGRH